MSREVRTVFSQPRLNDREVAELVELGRDMIADGVITSQEAALLQTWLSAHGGVTSNPVVCNLLRRIKTLLADRMSDRDEVNDLFDTLERFTGGRLDLGELLTSASVPFDEPAPEIKVSNAQFCFTGTFAYGSRSQCRSAVERFGGMCGPLTPKTHYLVVGVYTTENWRHSSYGQNIERATAMKAAGAPISIVSEPHWLGSFPA
jgi:NAD-dependent DNA ligase